ncbi:hypothetical protein AYI68_g345 [Smittium mucronatum]|uniref:J domain-containing protein n=1 Tax=Smittium mucronatum TaxID=133383 RepID=A0A1R0H8I6_9FUNG|nr:hypothetical protein AYI68_g345 [Smittium mucronatum]
MKCFKGILVWDMVGGRYEIRLNSRQYQSSSRSMTPHGILGLAPNSTKSEIKARYYELCKVYHPDKLYANSKAKDSSLRSSSEKFKQIQWAYEKLIRNRPPSGKPDFSNYDFYNRAAFYEQQQKAYDRKYDTYTSGGYGRDGYTDQYGFYYSNNENQKQTGNSKNRILAGALFGFVSISGYGFFYLYNLMHSRLSESLDKSHLEALATLRLASMKRKGKFPQRHRDLEKKNIGSKNSQYPLSSEFIGNGTDEFISTDSRPRLEHDNQAFYLSPTKDEQIMRFLATFDFKEGRENVCFPYGRFK